MVPNLGYFVTAALNIPVWDWGTLRSKLHQAEYKQQQAKAQLSQAQRQMVSELYAAYNEAVIARSAVDESRHTAELAAESLRLMNLRYQGGASPASGSGGRREHAGTQHEMLISMPRPAIELPWQILQTLTGSF